jgi:hypothetical protein
MGRTANICNSKQCLSPLQQIWLKCHSTFNEIYTVPNCLTLSFKSSINENIRELWSITSTNRNVQYDIYSNTKYVLNAFRQKNEQRLQNNLMSQGYFFSNIVKNSTLAFNSLWSSVHSKLPKNIFNFSLRYC